MYELIADIMVYVSLAIVTVAIIKVSSLYSILFSYGKKSVPAKVQISVLFGMIVYMVSVFVSYFSLTTLLVKLFSFIIPGEIPKLGIGLSLLISSFVIYPQSPKLLNFITAYLKKHGLLKEDSNALHGEL